MEDFRCQNVGPLGERLVKVGHRGTTGDEALKLASGQIGKRLKGHAKFL